MPQALCLGAQVLKAVAAAWRLGVAPAHHSMIVTSSKPLLPCQCAGLVMHIGYLAIVAAVGILLGQEAAWIANEAGDSGCTGLGSSVVD